MLRHLTIFLLLFYALSGCSQKSDTMTHKYTNALINETSPYLLQHAHNPVNWEAWGPEVLELAKKENKLLLVSIGYAACHWCHVMEKECFEDEEVAEVMNGNFINIKIDREERPDIDHIYMDAVQMMTGSGGWPLNVVALPDGRPFWGATYVQKDPWIRVLKQLSELYEKDPEKVTGYAEDLAEGIKAINLVETTEDAETLTMEQLDHAVKRWSDYFDTSFGGYRRAPKFMMPANLDFLLHYATARTDRKIMSYVNTTLTRMAYGGIYDQVGGGFSRYSVDTKWHVPHFEKMLYDNGQLLSLYSKAYAATGNELYKKVVRETINFVTAELMDDSHGFYSSLDADSFNNEGELEEGAFYVWKKEDLKDILSDNFEVFQDYYNINSYGLWEHGNYVLIRNAPEEEIAEKHSISLSTLNSIIEKSKEALHAERSKRERPRLDDKILGSWNGLMLKGLIDAHRYLEDDSYLELALKNAQFIEDNFIGKGRSMFHNHKNGTSTINGYLEDYAAVADAFIGLYEITFDEKWLNLSKALLDHCIENFLDPDSGLFFFTSKQDAFIIRRTLETSDNVVPASNSIMAKNLFKISKLFPESGYEEIYRGMIRGVQENFDENAQGYANWLHLILYLNQPFYEIAVVGQEAKEKGKQLQRNYLPNSILTGTDKESSISLLKGRLVENQTLIYVCQRGSCKLPVSKPQEALEQLEGAQED